MKLCTMIFIFTIIISTGHADDMWKDVNNIANILEASEAAMPDLKIKYSFTAYASDADNTYKVIESGIYACKKPEGLIMIDKVKNKFDAMDNSKIFSDIRASFKGKTTYWLNREKRTHDIMMAMIYSGYNQRLIDAMDNPDWQIWRIGRTHISDFLKEQPTKVQKIGEEIVQNVKTVKLRFNNDSNTLDFTLWVSPEKDFLPIKYRWFFKKFGNTLERTLCDLFQLNNGRWYPRKIIIGKEEYGGYIAVDNVDTNTIPREFFTLKFPPNTHVTDHIIDTTYMINPTIPGYDVDSDVLLSCNKDYSKSAEKVMNDYLESGSCSTNKPIKENNPETRNVQNSQNPTPVENNKGAKVIGKRNKYFSMAVIPALILAAAIVIAFLIKIRRKPQ